MMLGTGVSAVTVVIILEFILAVYSIALMAGAEKKWLKIVHALFAALWAVLALLNIFF